MRSKFLVFLNLCRSRFRKLGQVCPLLVLSVCSASLCLWTCSIVSLPGPMLVVVHCIRIEAIGGLCFLLSPSLVFFCRRSSGLFGCGRRRYWATFDPPSEPDYVLRSHSVLR